MPDGVYGENIAIFFGKRRKPSTENTSHSLTPDRTTSFSFSNQAMSSPDLGAPLGVGGLRSVQSNARSRGLSQGAPRFREEALEEEEQSQSRATSSAHVSVQVKRILRIDAELFEADIFVDVAWLRADGEVQEAEAAAQAAAQAVEELNEAERSGKDMSEYPHWTPHVYVQNCHRWCRSNDPKRWFSTGARVRAPNGGGDATWCTVVHMRLRGLAELERLVPSTSIQRPVCADECALSLEDVGTRLGSYCLPVNWTKGVHRGPQYRLLLERRSPPGTAAHGQAEISSVARMICRAGRLLKLATSELREWADEHRALLKDVGASYRRETEAGDGRDDTWNRHERATDDDDGYAVIDQILEHLNAGFVDGLVADKLGQLVAKLTEAEKRLCGAAPPAAEAAAGDSDALCAAVRDALCAAVRACEGSPDAAPPLRDDLEALLDSVEAWLRLPPSSALAAPLAEGREPLRALRAVLHTIAKLLEPIRRLGSEQLKHLAERSALAAADGKAASRRKGRRAGAPLPPAGSSSGGSLAGGGLSAGEESASRRAEASEMDLSGIGEHDRKAAVCRPTRLPAHRAVWRRGRPPPPTCLPAAPPAHIPRSTAPSLRPRVLTHTPRRARARTRTALLGPRAPPAAERA